MHKKEEPFLYSSFFFHMYFLVIANTHISLNPFPSTATLALSNVPSNLKPNFSGIALLFLFKASQRIFYAVLLSVSEKAIIIFYPLCSLDHITLSTKPRINPIPDFKLWYIPINTMQSARCDKLACFFRKY